MIRYRRLKKTNFIRKLVRDTYFSTDDLIYPVFVEQGNNIKKEIKSMPGQYRYSIDRLEELFDEISKAGINNVLVFGIPLNKDETGSEAYNENGIVQNAVRKIKKINNDITIITDVCMCEYTSHGHCGILKNNQIDNEATLPYLAKIVLSHVKAGADMIAPSDMMDNRIGYIRRELDINNYYDIPIMSYSVKYASSYYGPFRDAAGSAPKFGDRKTYQMDFHRKKEALSKVLTDIEQGADIIMIKPVLAYLDIVKTISAQIDTPVAVYNVSGEYAMIKAAGQNGWIDEKNIVLENITAMKRAGADIIITYHALDIAKWLKSGEKYV